MVKKNPFVVKRSLDPQLDSEFKVFHRFNSLQKALVITLYGIFYPCLLQEFYANIEDKEADLHIPIHSHVKDVKITVSRKIATTLNIPDQGPTFDMHWEILVSDRAFPFTNALHSLHLWYHPREKKPINSHLLSKDVPIYERIIVAHLGSNVMPRAGKS